MFTHWKVLQALLIGVVWGCVCVSQAPAQLVPPKNKGYSANPDMWPAPGATGTSKPVDNSSAKSAPEKKEKRANTPPGKDRAGDAPASGAVVDPGGVTTK